MEPESSLPYSQAPATCLHPEPARSSPYPSHPTSWRSVLILYSHLRLVLPSGLLPSGFPTKILYTPLHHTCYVPRQSHSSRFYHPKNIGWAVQIIQLLIMQFPPVPCYLVPRRSKHPQPSFSQPTSPWIITVLSTPYTSMSFKWSLHFKQYNKYFKLFLISASRVTSLVCLNRLDLIISRNIICNLGIT